MIGLQKKTNAVIPSEKKNIALTHPTRRLGSGSFASLRMIKFCNFNGVSDFSPILGRP